MKPDETNNNQTNAPLLSKGSTQRVVESEQIKKSQDAAANIIRHQIDSIFSQQHRNNLENEASSITPVQTASSDTHTQHTSPQAEQWKKYHTAWQTYYQKYYEGYYNHQFKQVEQDLNEKYKNSPQYEKDQKLSEKNRIKELKAKLLDKVQDSAGKVRKSRHFIPIVAGLGVVLVFLFLQYNRIIISNIVAYVSPGDINPQNIVIDPNSSLAVSADPRLIIPKINVDVPVSYDIGSDYNSQMSAMAKGVAHFAIPGANSHPGEIGNTVIAGHSSNDLLDSGDYKFIFAQLDKLSEGDVIYANYHSKRYTYTVTKKEVVNPNEVNKLTYSTTKPVLTLITCTPLGTSKYRLLITADQVSPDPAQAIAASSSTTSTSTSKKASIPGNSPTLLEKLFGSK